MKTSIPFWIGLILFVGISTTAYSQRGIISDKVRDNTHKEVLSFASVASFAGYEKQAKVVAVRGGETTVVNFELTAGQEIEEVVISVQARGQIAASIMEAGHTLGLYIG